MGEHTPGPWIPSYFGLQVLTGDSWNTICTLHSSNGDHRLAGWEDGRKATSAEANAWLIAAAPELLAALQGLLSEWDKFARYGSPLAKAANERVNAARAALAKATTPGTDAVREVGRG